MITKKAFYAISVLIVVGLVYNMVHFLGHPQLESLMEHSHQTADIIEPVELTGITDAKDIHIHKYYWNGVKSTKQLVKTYDKSFGEPKTDVKHRHTGNDYILYGVVTWKHVSDQHKKLGGE